MAIALLSTMGFVTIAGAQTWPLNEGSGASFTDTTNQHPGALFGAGWTTTPSGEGLAFRGDAYGDYASATGPFTFQGAMTMEVWFKLTGHENFDAVLSSDASCWACYRLLVSPDLHPFFNAGQHLDIEVTAYTFVIGQWYHYAMVIVNQTATVYVNGQPIFASISNDGTVPDVLPPFNNVHLGIGEDVGFHPLQGVIDQAAILSSAPTPDQMLQRYLTGPIPASVATAQIQSLISSTLMTNLAANIQNQLDAKLSSALATLDAAQKNSATTAANQLQAFVNNVAADVYSAKLQCTQASLLIGAAQQIATVLRQPALSVSLPCP